jgi:hypothetical protein
MKPQDDRRKRFLKSVGGLILGAACGAIIAYLIPAKDPSALGERMDFMEGVAAMDSGIGVILERVAIIAGGAVIGLLVGLSLTYKRS